MNTVRVLQSSSGRRVADRAHVAGTWWHRLRGLLGRPALRPGEGMLLLGCDSVHTVGMGYPIDVAFLNREGRVVRTVARLDPWRVGVGGRGAVHALELPAGRLAETGIRVGTHLDWS
jgi:uncharacterized membrane protein (UPF0127 family)